MKSKLNQFIIFFKSKILQLDQSEVLVIHSYKEELNRQCLKFLPYVNLLFLIVWIPYIPMDLKLHSDEPLIVLLRLGLSLCGIISMILFYGKWIKKNAGTLLIQFLGAYLLSATAVITAFSKGDEVYTSGLILVIMCTIIMPLRFYIIWVYIILTLFIFFTLSYFMGMTFYSLQTIYAWTNLIAASLVSALFVLILDKMRYSRYVKSTDLIKEKNQLQHHNDILAKELDMAKSIQQNLMPSETPNSKVSSLYKPMAQLGGDFFDFIQFKDSNQFGIFVSDVSGHGVPAAFITSMIKSFLLKAGNYLHNPAELLTYLNDLLFNKTAGHFITAFYGIYHQDDNEFIYSNAGHNLPYLISKDKIEAFSSVNKSLPLAILNKKELFDLGKEYQNNTIQIEPNNRILLYTDGLVETVNIHVPDKDFGTESLLKLINEYRIYKPKDFVIKMFDKLIEFRGSTELEDDVCIICLDT